MPRLLITELVKSSRVFAQIWIPQSYGHKLNSRRLTEKSNDHRSFRHYASKAEPGIMPIKPGTLSFLKDALWAIDVLHHKNICQPKFEAIYCPNWRCH